jgi:lysophospholipase L1-like esterase
MKHFRSVAPGLLMLLVVLLGVGCRTIQNSLAEHDSSKWEKSIAAFEASDRTNPPPQGCIVFVGSSSVRRWFTLSKDYPDLPVVNRGFGGSQLADSWTYADGIILPYRPKQVIIYAGGNDINAGKDPQRVFGDFVALVKKIHKGAPDARIGFISLAPTLARWHLIDKFNEFNSLAKAYCQSHNMDYINVYPLMLGSDGKPKNDIFVKDGLHLNEKGYTIWREAVAPCLLKN